jgi:Ca-activated chloride channel family protein
MEFARPANLAFLAILPSAAILLIWAARRRRADVARIGSPALIAALSNSVSSTRRRWKTALWIMAMAATVFAAARPQWGTEVEASAYRPVYVMVALDVSASMLAEDIKPNRLARAKLTVEELMDRLSGSELGLVLFAGAAFIQFPLTADTNTAHAYLDAAGPWTISRPGTALEDAIRVALDGFPDKVFSTRVILLLTDGEAHEGDASAAARAAIEADATIFAIGFGSPSGEPIPIRDRNGTLSGFKKDAQGETVLTRLNESTLQEITAKTGGIYIRASSGGADIGAITDAIYALDSNGLETQFEVKRQEGYQWFAGLALLALAAELLISERVNRETQPTL